MTYLAMQLATLLCTIIIKNLKKLAFNYKWIIKFQLHLQSVWQHYYKYCIQQQIYMGLWVVDFNNFRKEFLVASQLHIHLSCCTLVSQLYTVQLKLNFTYICGECMHVLACLLHVKLKKIGVHTYVLLHAILAYVRLPVNTHDTLDT